METARIEKRIGVRASTDRIWELIADLPGWDRWNPVETSVEGTIAYGGSIALTETIPGLPERRASVTVGEWTPYSQLVWLEKRGLWFRSIRYFEIEELEPGSCVVANGFIFSGLRGEMYFDRHRKALRKAVDSIAEAMKTAAEA
ncbi:SRPBCC domain-containing protein [Brevundimonas sp.]|uniref:SRPBCC domain-containing protein n=1 Tax=Brevundimonas sp. TaxID=1871086 RepID=UPI002D638D5B|nr:SRPBCC domain-containing protein [Brevundimonas sp.]HYC74619.1 SRPBCC domain-containing protein [Brevundimonas sp.]